MAQGSTNWSTGDAMDDRAVVGLIRSLEGAVPGCPVDVAITEADGKEHRLKATVGAITLEGLTLDVPGHHGLIGKTAGGKLTVWVGTSMFRFKCRFRPGKGRAIDLSWGEAPRGNLQEPINPLGHLLQLFGHGSQK